jgi:hypothetical protein
MILQTPQFYIKLLVKDFPSSVVSSFTLQLVDELEVVDIDLSVDDVLHNLVTKESQLMEDGIPWRGFQKKDPIFFQMLIEATIWIGNIVVDCTASIGKLSFHTSLCSSFLHLSFILVIFNYYSLLSLVGALKQDCGKANCHIVAMEDEKAIFKGVIAH